MNQLGQYHETVRHLTDNVDKIFYYLKMYCIAFEVFLIYKIVFGLSNFSDTRLTFSPLCAYLE